MSQPVTDYINNLKQEWQVEVCQRLDEVVHAAIPDLTDRLQYGKPHYLKNGKYAAVLSAAKAGVSFTVFNATALDAPDGFFEPGGPPERKTIKIKAGDTVDYAQLQTLLQQAAAAL